jgi:carbon starvation protein
MNAMPFVIGTIAVFVIAYRLYFSFIAAKVAVRNDLEETPAHRLPGNLLTSGLMVFAWVYLIYTGTVSTIWPMFGTANQLLATIALTIGTSFIINRGRKKYAWVTILPMVFVGVTTMTAAYLNIKNIYIPQVKEASTLVPGLINLVLTISIMICVLVIVYNAVPKWIRAFRARQQM